MDNSFEAIIRQAREDTGETDYSDDNGISQSVVLEALKDAQIHIRAELGASYPEIFDLETTIAGVANQAEYVLPARVYLGGSIYMVEYSHDSQATNYYLLNNNTAYSRVRVPSGMPTRWIPGKSGYITIDPVPNLSTGTLRVTYGKELDKPAIRAGLINARTLNGGATQYETITLENDSTLNESELSRGDYVCINNVDGEVKYYNLRYVYSTGYNSTTKTLTFYTPAATSGGTISVGDYITVGKNTCTHSFLDNVCEPTLAAFARRKLYLSSSSSDAADENDNISIAMKTIVKSYQHRNRGPKKVPYKGIIERVC